jgi:hypothetical protein
LERKLKCDQNELSVQIKKQFFFVLFWQIFVPSSQGMFHQKIAGGHQVPMQKDSNAHKLQKGGIESASFE